MSTTNWIAGARPRTLWTAVSAVAVGTASAAAVDGFNWQNALLALGVALSLQIASNYANDYSDGVRGTDVDRVGPDRLVATGSATPSAVKAAAFACFGVGAILGLALVVASGMYWLLIVGVFAIWAAWYYTGSSRPYGYSGWGEVSVLVFFGPVAVLGTMLTQAGEITWWAVVASVGVGLYAVAMLMVNNIRDLDTDVAAGKHTLVVKLGSFRARQLFAGVVMLPVILAVVVAFAHPWALLSTVVALPSLYFAIALRVQGAVKDRLGVQAGNMSKTFAGLSVVGSIYGVLLAIGIAVS